MTTQSMDILAHKIVSLEKRHNALARAQQLPNSSVRLVDGDDVGLADSAEATKDIGDEAAYLGDWLTDADNNLDDNAEYGVEVPEWIQDAGHAGDVAWDSTQFATDLALTLDTELTQAKQELEQAQIDLTQALADSATALQEAQEALQEAEDAVTAANSATAAASAAEATAQAAQTAAGSAQDAADQAVQDALAATNTANTAQNTADAAQTTANAKGKVIIQSAAPDASDRLPQNLWIDTTGGANTPKRWSGSVWVAVTDKAATDAAAAAVSAQNRADDAYDEAVAAATVAGNAQAAANGKNRVWYQATAPTGTGHSVGDTWFNTGDSNKISRWNGSAWTATLFGTNAIDNLAITNALIADATIQNAKIANLDAAKITTGYLAAARIQAGTIVADKLATDSVTSVKIAANAVTTDKVDALAITTAKLAAGSVIADKIATNAVTAVKIAADAVTAGKIQAQAIDGMTITGALIRTAATGQRMQFDVNGLKAFNSSGTETATLTSDAGGIRASGALISWAGGSSPQAVLSSGGLAFTDDPTNPWQTVLNVDYSGISTNSESVLGVYNSSPSGFVSIAAGSGPRTGAGILLSPGIGGNGSTISLGASLIKSTRIIKTLWSGAWTMHGGQEATLSELVSDQLNGIILVWSRYSGGTAHNDSWNYTYIPKAHTAFANGAGVSCTIAHGSTAATSQKYVYVSNDKVTGNNFNSTAPNNWSVLRRVLGY